VTYAEITKIALELTNTKPVDDDAANTSAKGTWSSHFVATMEKRKISVFKSSNFDVNAPAPRGAVVDILLRTFDAKFENAHVPYSDVPKNHRYFDAIAQATADGIVSGDGGIGTFRPDDSINRAEAAKIALLSYQKYGRESFSLFRFLRSFFDERDLAEISAH
jgi:hypothetical protein